MPILRVNIEVSETTVEVVVALDRLVGQIGRQYGLPLNRFFVDRRPERPCIFGYFDIPNLTAEQAHKKGKEICQKLKACAQGARNVKISYQYMLP